MMRRDVDGVDFGCGAAKTEVSDVEYLFVVCHFETAGTAPVQPLADGMRYPNSPPLRAPYPVEA